MERTEDFLATESRFYGEMLDRKNRSNGFEFSFEELFPDVCDQLPATNCCCGQFIPIEEIVDPDVDIEAAVDYSLIRSYKKAMKRKEKKAKQEATRKRWIAEASLNETPFSFEEVCEATSLAPAYPYKEGIKARLRN